ncbi:hypothetical protein ACFVZC_09310 [Streptomyces marokkonensis]|uniref:Uncharacterized protein n=1 Tax=Streptomyces marokkonensis TaxID=324855 RepID=A0ABW6Q3C6_9ACTN
MDSGKDDRATPRSGHVCGSCKLPVDAVVERHKTMGIFVPAWVAGPCHNPECEQYVPRLVPVTSARGAAWRSLAGWKHEVNGAHRTAGAAPDTR